ncbi:hypothetical protein BYT27DRAFT_7184269 [Phlegmacium glaucopus]|nr:hypothetical protein BYT27DRAFT_7184269 [Phlegmacium glaucopus]
MSNDNALYNCPFNAANRYMIQMGACGRPSRRRRPTLPKIFSDSVQKSRKIVNYICHRIGFRHTQQIVPVVGLQ